MNNNIDKKRLKLLESTCYDEVEKHTVACMRKTCKQWIDFEQGKNCIKVSVKNGPLTLNEIGKIYGLTRMRICQIEKGIYQKIRRHITQMSDSSS